MKREYFHYLAELVCKHRNDENHSFVMDLLNHLSSNKEDSKYYDKINLEVFDFLFDHNEMPMSFKVFSRKHKIQSLINEKED